MQHARLFFVPFVLTALVACLPDPVEVLDDIATDPATLPGPVLRVTVNGDTEVLDWDEGVLTETEGLSMLTFEARNNDSATNGVVSDNQPLTETAYPLGPWGDEQQATAIAVGGIFGGTIDGWAVGDTVVPGEVVIDALDRDAGSVSFHFSGDFISSEGATVQIEGDADDVPLVIELL